MTSFLAWSRSFFNLVLLTQVLLCHTTLADKVDSLFTSSVTYCAPPEAILIDEFSIVYFAANQTVTFNISAASVVPNLNVTANIFLNVYGMQPINLTENFCSILNGVVCPLPTYNFTGSASLPLPSLNVDVGSVVPKIAYKIPDLEAFAQLTLTDTETGAVAACIQATLSNGWSARQPAVAYTTGGLAVFALFSSLVHSLLPSTPFAPSPSYNSLSIAPTRFVDYVLLFQQIALTGFLHLNFPLVYRAFVTNFAWSLGLFPGSQPIQAAINRLRHLTGSKLGDGVQNPIAFVNRALSPYNELSVLSAAVTSFARSLANDNGLLRRVSSTQSSTGQGPPPTVTSSDGDVLSAGIPVYVNALNIGTANAFMSVFFTVLIGAVVGAGILGIMYLILTFLATRMKSNRWAWADVLYAEFRWFAVSNGIRYAMIILYPILILTFFEWTLHDSWLVIFLSVILLILTGAAILYPTIRTVLISRRQSSEVLYTIPSLVRTYGALYIPYKPPRYHIFIVLFAAATLKSMFIGFAQSSGLTQVTANFIIEFTVLVLLCFPRPPFRSRGGDILGIYLAVTRVVGAILMFPFVEKFHIKPIPRVAVGFVLMALFSVAVVVLTFNVFFHFGKGLFWMKQHGDEHLQSFMGSAGGSSDIEKQPRSNLDSRSSNLANDDVSQEKPQQHRPRNPTPTTTFSQEHERARTTPQTHSRHTPDLNEATSPGFTIPSVYTHDDTSTFRSALPSTPGSGGSGSQSSSAPSTARSSRFSHRYESGSDSQHHHQHRLSTHEED